MITEPKPFREAIDQLGRRTPIASSLSSAEWDSMPIALRDRAFFSARVLDANFLAGARRQTESLAAGKTNRAAARTALKGLLGSLGADVDETDVQDLRSDARLNLILDTNLRQAQGYGHWKQGQNREILDQWPAQELIRVQDAQEPRDWAKRWAEAGGRFFGGRMIALKNDPIWRAISRFGTPYPPFDFGSGMDVVDVDRDTAIEAGLLREDETIEPDEADFNSDLQASIPDASPGILQGFKDIFGDQVEVGRDGKITWQGSRIRNLYEKALSDDTNKWTVDLGAAQPSIVNLARSAGVDLTGAHLQLDADHIRHAAARHGAPGGRGPGTGETQGNQTPLTSLDFELLPHVWREPDAVEAGKDPGTLVVKKDFDGDLVMATYERTKKGVRLATLWKMKGGTR